MADLPVRRFAVTDGVFGVTWVLFAMAVAVTPQAQLQQILAAGLFGIVSFCVGAGIGGEDVRDVKVLERFAFLSVPEGRAEGVVEAVSGADCKGTRLELEPAGS